MDQALRPMSTAQVLDRTFFLYRSNFVLFAGIASIPPAFLLVAQMIGFAIPKPANNLPGFPSGIAAITAGVIVGIGILLYLVGYSLATGASIYAVSNCSPGENNYDCQSYRSVSNRVGAIIGDFHLYGFGDFCRLRNRYFGGLRPGKGQWDPALC